MSSRIRKAAARKVRVSITRKKRARVGFVVEAPTGGETFHLTKREAMTAMFVQVRVSLLQVWRLKAIDKK
ncbi:MAG: hypothetical protein U1F65_05840 [Verrucomicrobiota bacterium]